MATHVYLCQPDSYAAICTSHSSLAAATTTYPAALLEGDVSLFDSVLPQASFLFVFDR